VGTVAAKSEDCSAESGGILSNDRQ